MLQVTRRFSALNALKYLNNEDNYKHSLIKNISGDRDCFIEQILKKL